MAWQVAELSLLLGPMTPNHRGLLELVCLLYSTVWFVCWNHWHVYRADG